MSNTNNPLVMTDLLPDVLNGWRAEKTIPLKVNTDLYNYMDGGAELYISYGFGEALSRTYTIEGQPEVLAEVYDLLEPRNAFGVFTQTREEESQLYGQGTYAITGAVFFWKGRYYVSLSTWESSPATTDFIHALATFIESKISTSGRIPDVVHVLPEEGMVPFGYKYFHHPVWLNAYFFISDQNLFHIDASTDALIARYTDEDRRIFLLLVQYRDNQAANEAFKEFGQEFFPEGLTDHCIRLEDNTWLAASVTDKMIAAAFNSNTREHAGQLLAKALEQYRTQNK